MKSMRIQGSMLGAAAGALLVSAVAAGAQEGTGGTKYGDMNTVSQDMMNRSLAASSKVEQTIGVADDIDF